MPCIMCGLLLSTPTFLESPVVYYSYLIWTCEPSRHVLHVFPTAYLQPVQKWWPSLPSEMPAMFDGGRLLDCWINTKFRPLEKAKPKQNTLDLIHVSYTYLYIFHVQSYILNPRGSIIEINTEITTLLNELFAHRNEASASKRQQVGHSRTHFSDYRGQ